MYQMRLLGYPPGHLFSAKDDESGIALFDKDGNSKQHWCNIYRVQDGVPPLYVGPC